MSAEGREEVVFDPLARAYGALNEPDLFIVPSGGGRRIRRPPAFEPRRGDLAALCSGAYHGRRRQAAGVRQKPLYLSILPEETMGV